MMKKKKYRIKSKEGILMSMFESKHPYRMTPYGFTCSGLSLDFPNVMFKHCGKEFYANDKELTNGIIYLNEVYWEKDWVEEVVVDSNTRYLALVCDSSVAEFKEGESKVTYYKPYGGSRSAQHKSGVCYVPDKLSLSRAEMIKLGYYAEISKEEADRILKPKYDAKLICLTHGDHKYFYHWEDGEKENCKIYEIAGREANVDMTTKTVFRELYTTASSWVTEHDPKDLLFLLAQATDPSMLISEWIIELPPYLLELAEAYDTSIPEDKNVGDLKGAVKCYLDLWGNEDSETVPYLAWKDYYYKVL